MELKWIYWNLKSINKELNWSCVWQYNVDLCLFLCGVIDFLVVITLFFCLRWIYLCTFYEPLIWTFFRIWLCLAPYACCVCVRALAQHSECIALGSVAYKHRVREHCENNCLPIFYCFSNFVIREIARDIIVLSVCVCVSAFKYFVCGSVYSWIFIAFNLVRFSLLLLHLRCALFIL